MKKIALITLILTTSAMSAFASEWATPAKNSPAAQACDHATLIFKREHKGVTSTSCSSKLSMNDGALAQVATRVCSLNLNDMEESGVSIGECSIHMVQIELRKNGNIISGFTEMSESNANKL